MEKETAKTPIYKKWYFWVIIVVVLLLIAGVGSASGDKEPSKVGESGDASSSEQTNNDSTETKKEFKVGDIVAFDNKEVIVEKVQRNFTGEYTKPDEGEEYVLVTVKIENKGDEKASVGTLDWKVEDSDGGLTSIAYSMDQKDELKSGDLLPGGKKIGTLIFKVPKDDKGLKLHYIPNMFKDNYEAIISL